MHDAGCLGLVHWDNPEGWYGEGGGRRVQKKKKKMKFTIFSCLFFTSAFYKQNMFSFLDDFILPTCQIIIFFLYVCMFNGAEINTDIFA